MAANSYSNFIPMRMRGQSWMIGNIPILKIVFAILGILLPSVLILPLLVLNNPIPVYVVFGILILINQIFIWVPHSSGHTLAVALWLKFVFKISFNNFKNQSQAQIFDIYKYKTDVKKINETLKFKWDELKKNADGSYSLKTKQKTTSITSQEKFEELKKHGILKIQDGYDKTKDRYFVGFRVIGYDISHKSNDAIENIISQLHNIFKNIQTPHTLIKLAQPVNYQDNINALSKDVYSVINRNTNTKQEKVQRDILDLDIKRLSINEQENFALDKVSTEINWFLILNGNSLAEIKGLKEQIVKDFAKLKINLTLLSQNQLTNVFISLYAPYISFNDRNIIESDSEKWNEILNFNNIEFFQNALKVKPYFSNKKIQTYDTYMKVGVVKSYPTITPPFAWLYKLATAFDGLVIHNNLVEKDEIHKLINQSFENTELKRANTTNRSKKGEMDFLYNSFKQLSDSISSGNEVIYDSTIYTINYAFDKPLGAIKSFNQSKVVAKSLGFYVSPLSYEQRKGFGDLFIKSDLLLPKLKFPLPAYCYAYGFPFITSSLNDAKGVILGHTDKKEQFIFDMTKIDNVRKNHNMFILGNSGTGKSTFLKLLWMHLYGRGHKVFIVDPEAEDDNEMLVRNLNGTYIDMAATPINPLIINIYNENKKTGRWTYDIDNKASWLSEWLATIFGWENTSANTLAKSLLANWITKFYDHLEISNKEVSEDMLWPSMSEFYMFLKENVEKIKQRDKSANLESEYEIIRQLDIHFISGNTVVKKLWNTNNTTVDLSRSYLNSFNISKLINLASNIQRASYMLLLDLANKEMWRNKIYNDAKRREFGKDWNSTFLFLIFDEGHLMVDRKNPMTTSFLAETGARCRKYSTSLIIATQNVKTFTGDPEILYQSTRIINNTQYSMSLGLKENDIAELDKLWEPIGGLTEQEKEYLASAQKGDCIFSTSSQTRTQLQIDIGGDIAFRKYANFIKNDHEVKNQEIEEE